MVERRWGVKTDERFPTFFPLQQAISPSARLAICSQMDATNLDKAPKVGMNLALRN